MLPLELLKVIFGALSRDDLDALMLTNVLFRDVILRDFAKEPLRYIANLDIVGWQSYLFDHPWRTRDCYLCIDNDEFRRRMRLGRVGKLEFSNYHLRPTDENLLNFLLAVKNAWRDGHVDTPYFFASTSLLERAFTELLFCKSMDVSTYGDHELTEPFLSFPAVRECHLIRIFRPPCPLTAAEIVEWLNVDARSMEPKRLDIDYDDLDDGLENLVQQLKKDFNASKTARQYVVKISVEEPYDGQSGRLVNKDTAEVLTVSYTRENSVHERPQYVEVERKPMEEK